MKILTTISDKIFKFFKNDQESTIDPKEVVSSDGWVYRPWGKFFVVLETPYTKVKRLIIQPKKRTSLQSHKNRDERWVVVKGTPTFHIETNSFDIDSWTGALGSIAKVDRNTIHRISNETNEPTEIIEIQTGVSFEESDILRHEDDWGRK